MEKMLNEYLQFSSSSFSDKTEKFNISELIQITIKKYENENIQSLSHARDVARETRGAGRDASRRSRARIKRISRVATRLARTKRATTREGEGGELLM